MTPTVLHLISVSAKIVLLGGIAWTQLYLLRRAPARIRSVVCSLALLAVVLLSASEWLATPRWLALGPVFHLAASATARASYAARGANAGSWIVLLWAGGAVFMLLRAAAGRIALARQRRQSTFLEIFSGLDVRLAQVETPILTGVLNPAILLPPSARQWTDDQRAMVLAHELTHYRQGDCWTNLLAQALRAIFWFHPVLWLLIARLSREQELTCDEAVVAIGHSRHDYAAFLLDAVRNLQSREMFVCAMAGSGAYSMKQRFANLLDTRPRALSRRAAASMAIFAALAVAMVIVRPVWSQDENGAYRTGDGVTYPKVLHKVDPSYTQEDKDAKVSGTVVLTLVVTPEGKATHIRVVKPLSPGLDQKAIEALEQWEFQPGTKDGKPVPVRATIEMNFRLL